MPIWADRRPRAFRFVMEREHRLKDMISLNSDDLEILGRFHLHGKVKPLIEPVPYTWVLPEPHQIKVCTDGPSLGNPGVGGAGAVCRDYRGMVVASLAIGLGVVNSYMTEVEAILLGLSWATTRGYLHVWICSNSESAISAFRASYLPWTVLGR